MHSTRIVHGHAHSSRWRQCIILAVCTVVAPRVASQPWTAVHYYRDNGTVQDNCTVLYVTVDWQREARQQHTLQAKWSLGKRCCWAARHSNRWERCQRFGKPNGLGKREFSRMSYSLVGISSSVVDKYVSTSVLAGIPPQTTELWTFSTLCLKKRPTFDLL